MASTKKERIQKELDLIRKKNKGLLPPRAVVAFARNPKTALHGEFEWDNGKAAEEYRLWQARELIAVFVVVLRGSEETVRAYVSLTQDRQKPGGGYRDIREVLADPDLATQMLDQALTDFSRVQQKWRQLKRLVPIFQAIESVRADVARERPAAIASA